MNKRIICCLLALMICFTVCGTALAADARQAYGRCSMSNSGKNVSYSGYSSSLQIEDTISVTVKLMEKRGSSWYQVGSRAYSSLNNSDYVSAGSSFTVDGGHYYKVVASHYSLKDGTGRTVGSETSEKWISA